MKAPSLPAAAPASAPSVKIRVDAVFTCCQVCGEDIAEGATCCGTDDLPEPGEMRETGP